MIMATFKSLYTTSELLNILNRRSLTHYYWIYDGEYTFYFVDNRRDFVTENGIIRFITHRSNYYRLRHKVNSHPFRLFLDPRSKKCGIYSYELHPDSVFLLQGSSYKLKELNKLSDGKLVVNVVVL